MLLTPLLVGLIGCGKPAPVAQVAVVDQPTVVNPAPENTTPESPQKPDVPDKPDTTKTGFEFSEDDSGQRLAQLLVPAVDLDQTRKPRQPQQPYLSGPKLPTPDVLSGIKVGELARPKPPVVAMMLPQALPESLETNPFVWPHPQELGIEISAAPLHHEPRLDPPPGSGYPALGSQLPPKLPTNDPTREYTREESLLRNMPIRQLMLPFTPLVVPRPLQLGAKDDEKSMRILIEDAPLPMVLPLPGLPDVEMMKK